MLVFSQQFGVALASEDVQDDDPYHHYQVEVREQPTFNGPGEQTAGFGLAIETDDCAHRLVDLSLILDRTLGVSVRTLGGLGSFALLSIRGSSASQVLVLLDGVPLSGAALSQVDINILPPDLLARVDLYRSGFPLFFGVSPMGGAVNLITRQSQSVSAQASFSYGSFGTRRASGSLAKRWGELVEMGLLGAATYLGSQGDFQFYDDKGTPYNPSDDSDNVRQNNSFDSLYALIRADLSIPGQLRVVFQESFFFRHQGVPGLGQSQTTQSNTSTMRSISHLSLTGYGFPNKHFDSHLLVHFDAQDWRFEDPLGEIGLGIKDTSGSLFGWGSLLRLPAYVGNGMLIEPAIDLGWERLASENQIDPTEYPVRASRVRVGPILRSELSMFGSALMLSAGARYDLLFNHFEGELPFAYSALAPSQNRRDSLGTAQLGARLVLEPDWARLTMRINSGRYQRSPTFIEMYGDSGAIIGNSQLEPESALGFDLGGSMELAGDVGHLLMESAVFLYHYDDLIQFVQNSQHVARPENISQARIWGLELGASLLTPSFETGVSYTWLDPVDTSQVAGQASRQLPGRSRHAFSGRILVNYWDCVAEYTLDWDSGNVLDRANYRVLPARHFHGARLSYRPTFLAGWSLSIEGRNLLDHRVESVPLLPQPPGIEVWATQAVADFIGSPLPGRSLFATLSWELP